MIQKAENPALAARGVPEVSLAAGKIDLENSNLRPLTQDEAKQLARIVFGTPPRGAVVGFKHGLPYWRQAR